ncbi:MAG TPA: capsule assembly Wzi family protein [Bdellovibrionota bacterium]|nr:capsule assembly Wzi family protein [Bdellovibrionota bacterium]
MSERRSILGFAGALALALAAIGAARAEQIPWDAPEMMAFDHLVAGSGQGVTGLQPLSVSYALSLLEELKTDEPWAAELRQHLMERFSADTFQADGFRLSAEFRAGYRYVDSEPLPILELPTVVNPILSEQEDLFTDDGHLGSLGVRISGSATRYFSFSGTPMLRLTSLDGGFDGNVSFYLKEALGTVHINRFAIDGGRSSLMWGFGRAGHLLFSGDHQPLTLVRFRSDQPVIPPWFLKYLGPTRFEAFFSALEDNRASFPNSKLIGLYFTFSPHRRLEVGFGETAMYGGDGAPTNNPLVFFTEKIADGENPANRNFLLSARYRVPFIEIEPYTEIMIEDCCRASNPFNPRDTTYLAGLFFPKIDPAGHADFAVEFARINSISYRHGTYSSGYTYKNHLLGHPLGPDSLGIYAILRYVRSSTWQLKMVFAHEERGRLGRSGGGGSITSTEPGYEASDQRNRFQLLADLQPWDHVTISPLLGLENVLNQNYVKNDNHWQYSAGFEVRYLW